MTPLKKFELIAERLEKATRLHAESINKFGGDLGVIANDLKDLLLDVEAAGEGHWPRSDGVIDDIH